MLYWLMFCDVQDVARVACVNRAMRLCAAQDQVWEKLRANLFNNTSLLRNAPVLRSFEIVPHALLQKSDSITVCRMLTGMCPLTADRRGVSVLGHPDRKVFNRCNGSY